jgi:GNAT superfamily N-acetyltransferase
MGVRPMRPSDRQAVLALRLLLWPDDDGEDDVGEAVLVWEQDRTVGGFIIYSFRPWADGCTNRPVPYIEGWFVREDLRLRGVGRALVTAVEDMARPLGFSELGSDAFVNNRTSLLAHRRLGFEPTERLQFFRKDITLAQHRLPLTIEPFRGSRSELLPLFARADDSATEVNSYIELGEVLVARRAELIVGHLQLIPDGFDYEIKSLAVIEKQQGLGIGTALVRAALERAFSSGAARVLVATATADIENLRFYQRLGFRMDRIERDAFSVARGYPGLKVDDIPLRDKVWFSIDAGGRR